MNQQTPTLRQKLQAYERNLIVSELQQHQRLYKVATALGLSYNTLWRRMQLYGISR